MNNAYCFCPNFLTKLSVDNIIEALISKRNSIFLDDKNKLILEYTKKLKDHPDDFRLLTLLEFHISDTQKITTAVNAPNVDSRFLLEILTGRKTLERKLLASADRDTHQAIVDELKEHNITKVFPHNFTQSYNSHLTRGFEYQEFKLELEHSLALMIGEKKSRLENEYNSTLANCLKAKRYEVRDQTLHGKSSAGKTAGSLDLAIYDENLKAIIEPLRLKGGEAEPFYVHLNKLLDNYNPLRVEHTFLVVYFIGKRKNFTKFANDYETRLGKLDVAKLNQSSSWTFDSFTRSKSEHDSIRITEQVGSVNGSSFVCTHFVADFSD